ncbi:hypothetical protein FBUS_10338 [Fasciolopsis buskii]|uniref:Uncharacterized protein n=1 Tax=Fasciolopsis buskii TaxID=27845 RepID=A0A8E0VGI7_9TREM|nr:hypothetical protein FBUS_10338 [Fasciolopsis buski]
MSFSFFFIRPTQQHSESFRSSCCLFSALFVHPERHWTTTGMMTMMMVMQKQIPSKFTRHPPHHRLPRIHQDRSLRTMTLFAPYIPFWCCPTHLVHSSLIVIRTSHTVVIKINITAIIDTSQSNARPGSLDGPVNRII